MTFWDFRQSAALYKVAHWSDGYFDVSESGHALMRLPDGGSVDLAELPDRIAQQGLGMPVLVRFLDILDARLDRMYQAFDDARDRHAYPSAYTPIYPIKVNQQRAVVERLLEHGGERIGLEAGSKAELLAVMALSRPGRVIVCNGYKDPEYVRLALLGLKLGLKVYIVIEKPGELELVLRESRSLGITPLLGVRVRLATTGSGKWQNTGGERGKFGLSAGQVIALCTRLKAEGLESSLKLLHFHMGSQISTLEDIQRGMIEASRYLVEMSSLGMQLRVVDVGGGLGVDYEGAHSRSFCSLDYGLEDYAEVIVEALASACHNAGIVVPEIFTESGRAMTAHHAVLFINVIDSEVVNTDASSLQGEPDSSVPGRLLQLMDSTHLSSEQRYQQARSIMNELYAAFSRAELGLETRAQAEHCYLALLKDIAENLDPGDPDQHELLDQINQRLADKLFCNFSVFQSLPDVWGLDQVFPIMPLQRLDEQPSRRALIQDLTCDSDGHIEEYVDQAGIEKTLPVHAMRSGEPYFLGVFLVGAYQETLGDLHNLFGDTHVINVECVEEGFRLLDPEPGDQVDELLRYIHYDVERLMKSLADMAGQVSEGEREGLVTILHEGLHGYTYHED